MRALVLAAALLPAGCADPDVSSVDALLRTASPIAWAGTLAWAATSGDAVPCVRADAGAVLVLEPEPDCPPAIGVAPAGEALVTVVKASEDVLLFAAVFGDFTLDDRPPVLSEVGSATATRREGGILVAWADTDVMVDGAAADVVQGTWVVAVDTMDTPSDVADDTWSIQGARQWVAATEDAAATVQTALALAGTAPSCRTIPVTGGAVIEAVEGDAGDAGVDLGSVFFHDGCDGTATFVGAGSNGIAAGVEVDLATGG